MAVLSLDISSGGVAAALFDGRLNASKLIESSWNLQLDESGAATLSAHTIISACREVLRLSCSGARPDAVSIGSFMHNSILVDAADQPLTPVYTWLDHRGEAGVEYVRRRLGAEFHLRTGCQFHPMFPVFKLASLRLGGSAALARAARVVSAKSLLIHQLTGNWTEDHGMASASGLCNIAEGAWDTELLTLIGLNSRMFPVITARDHVAGHVSPRAASEFDLPQGVPVVNGSGDGFLAALGSDCESPDRIAMSLGTSASARQALATPSLQEAAGTFCYRADDRSYLLGCASNNGGNVLDWGRSLFGGFPQRPESDAPIFIPLLHGERSPDWNPGLTGAWYGLTSRHTASDLAQSIVEGVIFNLGHYVEILERVSGEKAGVIVLSGNGFLEPAAVRVLAAAVEPQIRISPAPGLASLRGAAICAFRALDVDVPPLKTDVVPHVEDAGIRARFQKYKILRKELIRTSDSAG